MGKQARRRKWNDYSPGNVINNEVNNGGARDGTF